MRSMKLCSIVLLAATSAGASPASPAVARQELVIVGGGRVDWSVQGDLLAFDRRGPDGFYDLYVARPDGSGERCLACQLLEFRSSHAYNPSWHPSGRLLVFQAQPLARTLELSAAAMASPDRGIHSELWTISSDGKVFFQLTPGGQGLLDPVFSHEGDLLAWSERVSSKRGRWGEWVLRVARFSDRAEVPKLGRVETLEPGAARLFAVAHGFTPDDKGLVVSGNFEVGQAESGMDAGRVELGSGKLTAFTRTLAEWDEQARFAPDGVHVAWTTDRNLSRRPQPLAPGTRAAARPSPRELWLRRAEGGGEVRLTYFNQADTPAAGTGALVSDFAWSPDGTQLAVSVLGDLANPREDIYLLTLAPPSERPPGNPLP